MTLRRFHVDCPLATGESVELEGAVARHIATVLRLRTGDPLILFDGRGNEFLAMVETARGRSLAARIEEPITPLPPATRPMHLGIALTRGTAMDYAIQKATELGATRISPLATERTEVKLRGARGDRRTAHWREVSASSCEQCGRHYLPEIDAAVPFLEWLSQCKGTLKILLHPEGDHALADLRAPGGAVVIASGPEGGFSDAECDSARGAGFELVRLGPRTLRAETAPLAALTLAQYLWGDLGGGS